MHSSRDSKPISFHIILCSVVDIRGVRGGSYMEGQHYLKDTIIFFYVLGLSIFKT